MEEEVKIDRHTAIASLVGGSIKTKGDKVSYLDGQTPPTESAINAKLAELIAAYPLEELREKRNQILAETDWMANKDVTLPAAWKTYRQALRDLPASANPTLGERGNLTNVTWPEKPE
jgi:hypothetical protein